MHNITCNIIDHGHFALSLRVSISLYLYGDGRCTSYLTGIRKQAMRLIKISASFIVIHVVNCEVKPRLGHYRVVRMAMQRQMIGNTRIKQVAIDYLEG